MTREFKEETSCEIFEWREFCEIKVNKDVVKCFMSTQDKVVKLKSPTTETVSWEYMDEVRTNLIPTVKDLEWLIPFAIDENMPYVTVAFNRVNFNPL